MKISDDLKAIVNMIKEDTSVISISLIGSAADEENLVLSKLKDLDLLVVRNGEDSFCREVKSYDGVVLDISYVSIVDLERMARKENHQWIRLLAKSKKIYKSGDESTPFFKKAKDIYFDGPDCLTPEDINHNRFVLTNLFMDVEAKMDNEVEAEFLLNIFLLEGLKIYFKLNNAWVPRDKKLLKTLFQTDIILYELVKAILKEKKLKKKIAISKDILCYILKPYGGSMENWEKGAYPLD